MHIQAAKIGNQLWMSENLEVKTFQNGDIIPFYKNIQDFLKAGRHQESACCYYENNPQKGLLYNWYAANDERGICPEGFKIPSKNDWIELFDFCGGDNIAGKNLKSTSGWFEPQNAPKSKELIISEIGNGTDKFGFNAKPMGALVKTEIFAEFFGFGSDTNFWTSDTDTFYSGTGFCSYLYYFSPRIAVIPVSKRLGFSVRCIKNIDL